MKKLLITMLMPITGVVVVVLFVGFYFGWFSMLLGGRPDFQIYNVKLYYDPISGKSLS